MDKTTIEIGENVMSLYETHQEVRPRIVIALMSTSSMSSSFEQPICADKKYKDVEQALHNRMLSVLVWTDQPVAEALMPLISQKFNCYLKKIPRSTPCIQ